MASPPIAIPKTALHPADREPSKSLAKTRSTLQVQCKVLVQAVLLAKRPQGANNGTGQRQAKSPLPTPTNSQNSGARRGLAENTPGHERER
jgi:hypothetical protein